MQQLILVSTWKAGRSNLAPPEMLLVEPSHPTDPTLLQKRHFSLTWSSDHCQDSLQSMYDNNLVSELKRSLLYQTMTNFEPLHKLQAHDGYGIWQLHLLIVQSRYGMGMVSPWRRLSLMVGVVKNVEKDRFRYQDQMSSDSRRGHMKGFLFLYISCRYMFIVIIHCYNSIVLVLIA